MTDQAIPEDRLHARVHGYVQGVNFRYYTLRTARQLGLTGWVVNRPDGTVEVVAEGSRQNLEELRAFLHRGSPAASVKRVDAEWQSPTGDFEQFQVRYR
jgi:acylphosphatase